MTAERVAKGVGTESRRGLCGPAAFLWCLTSLQSMFVFLICAVQEPVTHRDGEHEALPFSQGGGTDRKWGLQIHQMSGKPGEGRGPGPPGEASWQGHCVLRLLKDGCE